MILKEAERLITEEKGKNGTPKLGKSCEEFVNKAILPDNVVGETDELFIDDVSVHTTKTQIVNLLKKQNPQRMKTVS